MSKILPPKRRELAHVARRQLLPAQPASAGDGSVVEPARWSQWVTLDLNTAPAGLDGEGAVVVYPLVRWQTVQRDGKEVTVTGFAKRGSSSFALAFARARLTWRCDGIEVQEEFPWGAAGWVRRMTADAVEVSVVFQRFEGDVSIYTLGAALAQGSMPSHEVLCDCDPTLLGAGLSHFLGIRAPVGTTAVRLGGSPAPDGIVAWCIDDGLGILYPTVAQSEVGVAGSPFNFGASEPAANFLDWRAWDARYGGISYGVDVVGAVPRGHFEFRIG